MNLSWACQVASVCAAMSLLKFFQVQGNDPNCDPVKKSESEKRKCTDCNTTLQVRVNTLEMKLV